MQRFVAVRLFVLSTGMLWYILKISSVSICVHTKTVNHQCFAEPAANHQYFAEPAENQKEPAVNEMSMKQGKSSYLIIMLAWHDKVLFVYIKKNTFERKRKGLLYMLVHCLHQ